MTRHYRISVIMGLWVISLALGLVAGAGRTETIWLSSLDLSKAKVTDQVWPAIDKTINGNTLTINKRTYGRGVCVNGYRCAAMDSWNLFSDISSIRRTLLRDFSPEMM